LVVSESWDVPFPQIFLVTPFGLVLKTTGSHVGLGVLGRGGSGSRRVECGVGV